MPDGSYSVSGNEDYFKYTIKEHKGVAENDPKRIYVNKIRAETHFLLKQGIIS